VAQNKAHFAGFPRRRLTDLGRVFVETWLIDRIPEEAVHAIDVHRRRGEVVGIVSGAPEDLIRELAEPLGLDFVVGTDLDTREGILTGHVARGHISGETKVETAHKLARHFDFDLSRSSAYGNAYADRFLLSRVSRPVAVNPDERLRKLAESQGWPVLSYGGAS
jgi:HAD superfamily hydrolase (TIGR01490 family)